MKVQVRWYIKEFVEGKEFRGWIVIGQSKFRYKIKFRPKLDYSESEEDAINLTDDECVEVAEELLNKTKIQIIKDNKKIELKRDEYETFSIIIISVVADLIEASSLLPSVIENGLLGSSLITVNSEKRKILNRRKFNCDLNQ